LYITLRMKISQPKHKTKKRKRNSPHGRNENKYSTHGRIWISKKEETFLGYGRVVLLERIIDYGSITKAAKSMGMSYRNAWELVASMNKLSKKTTGGSFYRWKGGRWHRSHRTWQKGNSFVLETAL